MFGALGAKIEREKKVLYSRSGQKATTLFGDLYSAAMESSITSVGRPPMYRPSSFPICPVQNYYEFLWAMENGYFRQILGGGGGYFTSVGTAAHENIQRYIGNSEKIFGDWSCDNPRCAERGHKHTNTTQNKCPACGMPMEYLEKEINYKGLKGHIDAIIDMGDGIWVGDYKTATKDIILRAKLPKKEHLMQVPAYCYVLEKKYKQKVLGFSLLYLSRDNPYMFKEASELWTPKWRRDTALMLKAQRDIYKSSVRAFVYNKPKLAIDYKPCSRPSDFERLMPSYEPCPYADVCFDEKRLCRDMKHDYSVQDTTSLFKDYPDILKISEIEV